MTREEILAIAKPILFNTDMVRAILDDRKTVTRRKIDIDITNNCDVDVDGTLLHYQNQYGDFIDPIQLCRYQKGDYLYVRETWQTVFETEYDADSEGCCINIREFISNFDDIPKICAGLSTEESCKLMNPRNKYYVYKASDIRFADLRDGLLWRPSIHMPKEAARIFLKVTDVKIERLHTMTLDDFLAEGVNLRPEAFNDSENAYLQARNIFSDIWDSTIQSKSLAKYGWNANPFVWMNQFERVEV